MSVWRSAPVLLALGLVILAGAGAVAQRALAAAPGVVPDLIYGISEEDKQRTVEALEDLGSEWVRLNMRWAQLEPADGAYDEPLLDDFDRRSSSLARPASG